jgi:hypothetical protein
MGIMMFVLFGFAFQDFFEMVEDQTSQGYEWRPVKETIITTETAMPVTTANGDVYYWFLTKPGDE